MLDLVYLNRLTALVAIIRERNKSLTRFDFLNAVAWIESNKVKSNKPFFGFYFNLSPQGLQTTDLYISMIQDRELYNGHMQIKECTNGNILIENILSLSDLEMTKAEINQLREWVGEWYILQNAKHRNQGPKSEDYIFANKQAV